MKRLVFILLSGCLLYSCKKEQPQLRSLEEDCGCAKEVSADFTIKEIACYNCPGNSEYRTETDTSFAEKNVSFYASEDNAEYTWYIGNEILHTREIIRYFDKNLSGQIIPITLVVKKEANSICLPGDDGYDSIVKTFVVGMSHEDLVGYNFDTTYLEGAYRMKSDLFSDSIDIFIDYYKGISSFDLMLKLQNIEGVGSELDNIDVASSRNYRQFKRLNLDLLVKPNGEAIFNYLNLDSGSPNYNKQFHFLGRKLP